MATTNKNHCIPSSLRHHSLGPPYRFFVRFSVACHRHGRTVLTTHRFSSLPFTLRTFDSGLLTICLYGLIPGSLCGVLVPAGSCVPVVKKVRMNQGKQWGKQEEYLKSATVDCKKRARLTRWQPDATRPGRSACRLA